jgi:uncharacterized cupredoxin-like copper-binding protein
VTGPTRTRLLLGLGIVFLALLSTLLINGLSAGFRGPTTDTLASCQPGPGAGTIVEVSLTDFGGMMGTTPMMLALRPNPMSAGAGKVTLVATNYGQLNHELIVLPMPVDGLGTRPVGADGKVNESSSLGEASRSCGSGVGDGIAPGSRSWVTIDLQPGSYELVCDQPWHYANGMYTAFTVTRS